jgi:hypothetical protein
VAWPAAGSPPPQGAALPSLEGGAAELTKRFIAATGRATFTLLALADGTGAPPRDGGALRAVLRFRLVAAPRRKGDDDDDDDADRAAGEALPALPALEVPLAVTDKAARLAAQREAEKSKADAAAAQRDKRARADAAKRDAVQARRRRDEVCCRLRAAAERAGMPQAPPRDKIVERIAALEAGGPAGAAEGGGRRGGPRAAKRGGATAVAQSLEAVLAARDPGVVGAVADLAYVEDDALCRAASWHVGSRMLMCVVRDRATLEARRTPLREGRWRNSPICPFLALDMAVVANAPTVAVEQLLARYAVAGEPRALTQRRTAWVRAACGGSAEAAIRLSLPHQSADGRAVATALQGEKAVGTGLVGHLVNLVRPAVTGHRRSVLWAAMGDTLLFDTLGNAMAYKAAVVRAGGRCPALLSLDCERISGNGITEGGKPPGPSVSDLESHFGGAPAGDADEELVALRALLDEAEALTAAEAELRRAEEAAAGGAEARGSKRAAPAADEEELSEADEDAEPRQRHGRKSGCVWVAGCARLAGMSADTLRPTQRRAQAPRPRRSRGGAQGAQEVASRALSATPVLHFDDVPTMRCASAASRRRLACVGAHRTPRHTALPAPLPRRVRRSLLEASPWRWTAATRRRRPRATPPALL